MQYKAMVKNDGSLILTFLSQKTQKDYMMEKKKLTIQGNQLNIGFVCQ